MDVLDMGLAPCALKFIRGFHENAAARARIVPRYCIKPRRVHIVYIKQVIDRPGQFQGTPKVFGDERDIHEGVGGHIPTGVSSEARSTAADEERRGDTHMLAELRSEPEVGEMCGNIRQTGPAPAFFRMLLGVVHKSYVLEKTYSCFQFNALHINIRTVDKGDWLSQINS